MKHAPPTTKAITAKDFNPTRQTIAICNIFQMLPAIAVFVSSSFTKDHLFVTNIFWFLVFKFACCVVSFFFFSLEAGVAFSGGDVGFQLKGVFEGFLFLLFKKVISNIWVLSYFCIYMRIHVDFYMWICVNLTFLL